MKYEEINFGSSVNQVTGESWNKISVKVSLDKDDDKDKCFNEVKEQVGKWHSLNKVPVPDFRGEFNQSPYLNASNGALPIPLPTIDYSAKEKVEKAIDNAESLVELEGYMSEALQYKIVPQYNAKRKTFIEGKIN